MSSFLWHPPYSWFRSVSLFSCRLFPFSNKMNPVIDQRIAFPNPLSITSAIAFLQVLQWASYLGKSFLCMILLCFSHLYFSSDNSLDIIFSLKIAHISSPRALPSSSSKTSSCESALPSSRLLWPYLHHSKARADTELHRNGRDRRNKGLWE